MAIFYKSESLLGTGVFVKGYGFLSFAKNMAKKIGKNISKRLNK